MPFETYIPQRGPATGKSTVKILKSGVISVSPGAYDEWFQGAGHVELLFDSRAKKVGLKPRRKPTKASYKLRESPQGGRRRYVSAGQFLKSYGVSVARAKSHDAQWNAKEKLVEFSVK